MSTDTPGRIIHNRMSVHPYWQLVRIVMPIQCSTDSQDGQNVVEGDSDQEVQRKVEVEVRKHSHEFKWFPDRSISVLHRVPGELLKRSYAYS